MAAAESASQERLTAAQLDELAALLLPLAEGAWGLRLILGLELCGALFAAFHFLVGWQPALGSHLSFWHYTYASTLGLFLLGWVCMVLWAGFGRRIGRLRLAFVPQVVAQAIFFAIWAALSPASSGVLLLGTLPGVSLAAGRSIWFRTRSPGALWALPAGTYALAAACCLARDWQGLDARGSVMALEFAAGGVLALALLPLWAARHPDRRRQTVRSVLRVLDMPECGFDIITEHYRIVWLDRTQRERFRNAQVGDTCYVAIREREGPCEGCPVVRAVAGGTGEMVARVETVGDRVYQVSATALEEPTADGSRAAMETVMDVTEAVRAQERLKVEGARAAMFQEFAELLSHDVIGDIRDLQRSLAGLAGAGLPPAALGLVADARAQAVSAFGVLTRIVDPDRTHVELETFDPHGAVRGAQDRARAALGQADISVTSGLERGRFWVRADAELTVVILRELLRNAAKYAPPGSTVSVRVLEGPDTPHGCIEIGVEQEGPPLQPGLAEEVFRPHVGQGESSGLGLWLARIWAQRQGGDLRLAKNAASGVMFVLQLPIAHAPEGAGANGHDS